jgi:hypothetical protein
MRLRREIQDERRIRFQHLPRQDRKRFVEVSFSFNSEPLPARPNQILEYYSNRHLGEKGKAAAHFPLAQTLCAIRRGAPLTFVRYAIRTAKRPVSRRFGCYSLCVIQYFIEVFARSIGYRGPPHNRQIRRIGLAVTPFAFAKAAPVPLTASGFHPRPSHLREPSICALYGLDGKLKVKQHRLPYA